MFSAALDLVFIMVPALLLAAFLPVPPGGATKIVWLAGTGLAGLLYPVLFWWLLQATPGMFLAGTRLVTDAGGDRPGAARCSLRVLTLVLAVLPLGLGLLLAFSDRHGRALHDLLSATRVIEDDEGSKPLARILLELG